MMKFIACSVMVILLISDTKAIADEKPAPVATFVAPESRSFTLDEINAIVATQFAQKGVSEAQDALLKAESTAAARSGMEKINSLLKAGAAKIATSPDSSH